MYYMLYAVYYILFTIHTIHFNMLHSMEIATLYL